MPRTRKVAPQKTPAQLSDAAKIARREKNKQLKTALADARDDQSEAVNKLSDEFGR